jgi:protocatechuate 3,4-dioxygenase beta subunit
MLAAIIAALLLAQVPGRPPSQRAAGAEDPNTPKGTAVIRGRITAIDSGRPLRRAQIRLSSTDYPEGRSTSTNARGEFEFKDLPPGRYTVTVTRSGYLSMQYGQRYYGELSKPLQVDEGRVVDKVDFALPRAGVISGRVFDETGEPVSGVNVWVMRTEYFRGRRRAVAMGGSNRTDDIGQFRVSGVPPGEYTVMAWLPDTWTAGPEKQSFGYAPSYHPGTASYADALRVKVGPGQEASNVDVNLAMAPTATLSGTAYKSDGSPLAGSSVNLSREVAGPSFSTNFGLKDAPVNADGTWTMKNVSPGEYIIDVSSRDRPPERVSIPIVVQGTEVPGVALVTDGGGTISGQLVTDDGQPLPPGRGRPRIGAEGVGHDRQPMMFMSGDENGVVKPDGSFTLSGVVGPALVRVIGLPSGWRVQQVDIGGHDYAGKPLRPTSSQKIDGVRIVITNKFPTVTGRVTNEDGQPGEGSVVLMPEDDSAWVDTGLLYRARPDQTGTFRIESVRPGDYLAVAVENVESWQLQDPEYLATLRDRATRVTVHEGQPVQLMLKLAK